MPIKFSTLEVQKAPTAISNNDGQTHRATWFAEVDTVTCGDHILAMAQRLATASFASGAHYVPLFGTVFATEAGIPIYNGSDVDEAWVSAEQDRYADFGAVCMNAVTRAAASSRCNKKWQIDVDWSRPPSGRMVDNFTISPLDWSIEYWVEYSSIRDETEDGHRIESGSIVESGLMRNVIGDPLGPLPTSNQIAVLCIRYNTRDPFAGAKTTQIFGKTVNDGQVSWSWNRDGFPYTVTAAKHCARFQSSRNSDRLYWRNVPYYQVTNRIEIGRTPFYTNRLNKGYRGFSELDAGNPWSPTDPISSVDSNGTPYGDNIPLDAFGRVITNDPGGLKYIYYDYLLEDEADYSPLTVKP